MKYAEFTVGDLFIKKTVKGYPKSKENLTPVKNGYYVYGQNIKHQYNFKILMNDIYLYKIELGHPILAYTSSVGEIGLIEESFYRSGDNGAFQALIPKDNQISKYELQYIINFIDITPRFLPLFAEKFSFEYLRKSHKIPLFSNKLVTDYIRALTLACTAA